MRELVMEMTVKAYTLMLPYYQVALAVTVLVILPLAIWHKTRDAAGAGLQFTLYIFGLATWLLGAAVTFGSFGWIGLIIGLLGFGVGVVPIAIIGAIFKLDNAGLALGLFIMVVVTFAVRFAGAYAREKAMSLETWIRPR